MAADDELLSMFSAWQVGRNFSRQTVKRRRSSLRGFLRHIAPLGLADATPELIEEWVATHRAPRTRHAYRSDLAALYAWAVRRRLLPHNPVALTDGIRVPRSLPRPIDPSRVPEIVAAAVDPDTKLMVALAVYAGLRVAEIARLHTSDVSTLPRLIAVRNGKGDKDRIIPMHPALAELLAIRRVDGPIFHVSAGTVARRIAQHLIACGVEATAHQLRHTFGTELARVTRGNLLLVGALMGHDDVNTTKGYVGWSGEAAAPIAAMYGSRRR